MPEASIAEIFDILQVLRRAWPDSKTLNYADAGQVSGVHGRIERYIVAVQWLTDRGLITFEALMVDTRGLSLKDSVLTPKGREYSRTHVPAEINVRPDKR